MKLKNQGDGDCDQSRADEKLLQALGLSEGPAESLTEDKSGAVTSEGSSHHNTATDTRKAAPAAQSGGSDQSTGPRSQAASEALSRMRFEKNERVSSSQSVKRKRKEIAEKEHHLEQARSADAAANEKYMGGMKKKSSLSLDDLLKDVTSKRNAKKA